MKQDCVKISPTYLYYCLGYINLQKKSWSGQVEPDQLLKLDSGYENKNVSYYPESLRQFSRILWFFVDYTCRMGFSALREDTYSGLVSLAITRIYALVQFLFTNNSNINRTLTRCFIKPCLLKKYPMPIPVKRIPLLDVLVWT